MRAGDWLSKAKSVTRPIPVKDGSMWRGRKGMRCSRKTLREGAFLYHSVVDVMRRDVGELQRKGAGDGRNAASRFDSEKRGSWILCLGIVPNRFIP